jgi:hypothetical protein
MDIVNGMFNVPTEYRNYVIVPTVSHNEMRLRRAALKVEYLIRRFESVYGGLYFTVCSESRCAFRLRYIDMVVSIEVAVEVCCCFTVFSC